jgi:pimeloyl-ACP methyl ester carboxylesterase
MRFAWAALAAVAASLHEPTGALETTARMRLAAAVEGERAEPMEVGGVEMLPVAGFEDAVVVVPRARHARSPVVVVAHGAWDRPEPHCAMWREIVAGRAFVLCPRGLPTNPHAPPEARGYYYPDHFELGREIDAALAAMKARFGDRVDASRPVLVGFSQGAIDGALLLPSHAARFARAVLVEGGNGEFGEWGTAPARTLERRGGERVLIACGREHCDTTATRSAEVLRRAGVAARVLYVPGVGHTYGGAMERSLRDAFDWVIAGDPRWQN